jgi:hypothetical protein
MIGVDGGSLRWARSRTCWLGVLVVTMLVSVASAAADVARVEGMKVQSLADELGTDPVQVDGHPNPPLSARQRRALSARIAKVDPGRIWIAVVTPVSVQATGELAQSLLASIKADGVVIVVSGSNYHVSATWGTADEARERLRDAVGRPNDSLEVQMRRAIDSFAAGDATAGHPGAGGSKSGAENGASSGGGGGGGASGNGNGRRTVGVIALAVALAGGVALGLKYVLGGHRAVRRRRQDPADASDLGEVDEHSG